MNIKDLHNLSGLEYRLLKFFDCIKYLTQYDNNDHPDVIWGDIKTEVDKLTEELEGSKND